MLNLYTKIIVDVIQFIFWWVDCPSILYVNGKCLHKKKAEKDLSIQVRDVLIGTPHWSDTRKEIPRNQEL